ncbi:MAG: dihydrofolate reductase [Muribaculaceae bacterium]|nr:dihydrofolate reductase [Muribaculaceae bacterium]
MSAIENLTIIVAMARDKAIGDKGDLLCRLSGDLKRFKALTMGHAVIMGRKTFDSLPKGALPGRRNVVITRNKDFSGPDVKTASSLAEALALTADEEKRFIIGGAQIYAEAYPYASTLEMTEIEAEFPQADTRLNCFNPEDWMIEEESELIEADEKNAKPYRFVTLRRK